VIDAASLMLEKDVGCLIVSQEKGAVGIITERDILRKVTAAGVDPRKVSVKDIMSLALVVATIDTPIGDAAKKMIDNRVKRLVILGKDGAFVGLVTMTDLIRWMAKESEVSDALLDYLTYDVP
jgi:CBS domain-containing protein